MSKNTILYAIIFSVILCLSGNTAFSQLKVKGDNGKVIIGTVPDESSQQYVEDFDNILSASIFGKGEFYRSGAKLSFGDFGRRDYWGWNVFVGEYYTTEPTDTDNLWLHGKNGFYLTYGRAEPKQTILSFNVNGGLYHKVTNKDGIASLGTRLMSGKYIITSYWNDFQTGNTIIIS